MFDSLGNIATVITSKYGEQNHNNNEMIARDSVQVQNVNGKTLKTNDLIWIPNENRMISYGAVEIRDGQEVIYGDTLFGDENLKRYVVKKVRGRVLVTK
jgi:LPS export ABC transporter protein LptC